jgi:hypothetical protein
LKKASFTQTNLYAFWNKIQLSLYLKKIQLSYIKQDIKTAERIPQESDSIFIRTLKLREHNWPFPQWGVFHCIQCQSDSTSIIDQFLPAEICFKQHDQSASEAEGVHCTLNLSLARLRRYLQSPWSILNWLWAMVQSKSKQVLLW